MSSWIIPSPTGNINMTIPHFKVWSQFPLVFPSRFFPVAWDTLPFHQELFSQLTTHNSLWNAHPMSFPWNCFRRSSEIGSGRNGTKQDEFIGDSWNSRSRFQSRPLHHLGTALGSHHSFDPSLLPNLCEWQLINQG